MPNWPSMYLPFFRDWGWISTYPDSRYVLEPMADYWAPPYSNTPAATSVRHSGLDAFSDWHHPIFAVEEGKVVEVLSATKPNGNYGTFKFTGNIVAIEMEGGLVAIDEHMSETHVSEGDIVTAETQLGRQGTSGDSSGEHDHFKLFKNMQPIDPMPYLLGLKPWKTVIPTPQEESNMANLAYGIQYRYTDKDDLAIHSEPAVDSPIKGWVKPGEIVTVDAVAQAPGGHTMIHDTRGWYSMGTSAPYWFEPVIGGDTFALEAQIASLGACVDARDARIKLQDGQLVNERNEVTRLREIILDGPRKMDP